MEDRGLSEILKEIEKHFDTHEILALTSGSALLSDLLHDPQKGVRRIKHHYDIGLDEAYTDRDGFNNRGFIEATAGGPCESIPWAIYNTVGQVYPVLPRELKNEAIREILSILDGRNYAEVNGERGIGHTTGIHEPLLLADIAIARPLYWPGWQEQNAVIGRFSTFNEFAAKCITENGFNHSLVTSDYLMALALLVSPSKESYLDVASATTPKFIQRVVNATVALDCGGKREKAEQLENLAKIKEKLPNRLTPTIMQAYEAKDWLDYSLFR